MRRGRIFFYLALILLIGLIAVVVIWQRFLSPASQPQAQVAQPTPVIDVVNVLVITQHVPRGTVITRDVLSLIPIPRELFFDGMFSEINQVEGKLAKFDLDTKMILTSNMLVDSAELLSATGSDIALAIPRGMVAVAIPINRITNYYPPKSGDHVNVIVTMKFVDLDTDFQSILPNQVADVIAPGVAGEAPNYLTARIQSGGAYGAPTAGKTEVISGLGETIYSVPSEAQRPRLISQNLLQNVVVFKVGSLAAILAGQDEPAAAAQGEEQPNDNPEATPTPPPAPDFISLLVTPQDALTLNYLINSGAQLTMVLRNSSDDSRVQTEVITIQYLLNQYNISVPVKLPYSIQPLGEQAPTP
jgi:Flp pilus assembly protein CpaB